MIKRTKNHNVNWPTRQKNDKLEMLCQNSRPDDSLYPESLPNVGNCSNWVRVDHVGVYALCWECCQRMLGGSITSDE